MSNILFVTWDGGGNAAATALAHELVRRGHDVRVLGHAAGRPWPPRPALRAAAALRPSSATPLTMMSVFGDRGMGRDLLDAVPPSPPTWSSSTA